MAEALLDYYDGHASSSSGTLDMLTRFWRDQKHDSLLLAHSLLIREWVGRNRLVETHLLRGMLGPTFDVDAARGISPLEAIFFRGDKQLRSLRGDLLGRKISEMLHDLLRPLPDEEINIYLDRSDGHPTLRAIVQNTHYRREDKLRALHEFVHKIPAINVADLACIAQHLPQGLEVYGFNAQAFFGVDRLETMGSWGRHADLMSLDLQTLQAALRKTTAPAGSEQLEKIPGQIKTIVAKSCFVRELQYYSAKAREDAVELLLNEFKLVVDRVAMPH